MISRGLFYLHLGSSDFTDVTLACKDLQFEAHRLILSTCSPFLKQPLKKFKKQEQPLVNMGEVKSSNLEAVLDFIYQGETNVPFLNEICMNSRSVLNDLTVTGFGGGGEPLNNPNCLNASQFDQFKSCQRFNYKVWNKFCFRINSSRVWKETRFLC